MVPYQLKEGKSVNEYAGPRRGVDSGRGLWCPTLVGEENKSPFIRVWKPSPSNVFKSRTISASGGPELLQFELDYLDWLDSQVI